MQEETRIIGIDLGTTNSVVAVMEGNEAVVIPNQEGTNKTPSVVAFLDNNECIVGEIARRQAATNPTRTINSIKRLMGVDFEDIAHHAENVSFELVEHEDRLLIDINGLGYSPEQISALVLKKLKESAEAYLGQEVINAVITVPANFDDHQRNSTIEAARLAGLKVLRLFNEPTAAALAYGLGKNTDEDETIAIYDFGGGTFDITILEVSGKTFEVLTTTGDAHLGGDDLDNAIVNLIIEEFEDEYGVDLTDDPVTLRRLKEVAEKAKCELSITSQTMIALPFIAYREGQPLHLERQLARDEFEELIEAFVNRTVRCCKRAFDDAGLSKKSIDKVILVGGSTRIPLVQDAVEDFFGLTPFKGINPDEVVALGAATQAGVFSGNIEEVTLLDVAPYSLGIEVKDGKFSSIIEKNATIPIKAAKNFTTTEDDQTFVNIHILQGEGEEAAENRSLGKFMLSDIPGQKKGQARIRVTFFVNADGVMEISAEELSSGVSKTLTIVHSDLDESDKKRRRRVRQRKRARAGHRESSSRRYTAGQAADLSKGDSGTKKKKKRGSSSSVVRKREGSDVSPVEENFAMLGDTNPGLVPTAPVNVPVSAEAVPLRKGPKKIEDEWEEDGEEPTEEEVKARFGGHGTVPMQPTQQREPATPQALLDSELGQYPSPKRYGAPTREFPSAADDTPKVPAGEDVPAPPQAPPSLDDATIKLDSEDSVETHETIPGLGKGAKPAAGSQAVEEIDWPGLIDSALDLALDDNRSEEALELYAKALDLLNRSTWVRDERYGVMKTRAIFQMMLRRKDDMRGNLMALAEEYAGTRMEDINELYERAMKLFEMPAVLRRDRARIREAQGDLAGACEDMEKASKLEPEAGDAKTLERLYKTRIAESDDPAAKFKLVKIHLKNNEVDEAVEILQELQNEEAYETRSLKILGLCHWQKNLHFLAWQKFKQLPQNDEIRDILYRLGCDMESTGQLNNSLSVFEHIGEENESYRDVVAKIKKLRYRIKIQEEEADQSRASILTDPRFVIIEEINRGSMGIIYKARDKTLEEVVALKVLNDYLCADPSAVERFKREARAAKKLSHPYIVRIHDLFESGSKRFLSMEYIEGTDIKRILAEGAGLGMEQTIYYFLQICDALSYAHKLNIIHRDIKPANIMITEQNTVKVTDFGIAKILKGEDSTKSGTAIIGTPLYMAPEQITGEGVDARTDIYSLGIMMYEIVSGHPPFYLGNIEYHHIHTSPPPLPDSVPDGLQQIVMKCVEKNPANRFQSVDAVFNALQELAG